jgi:hypothetical protein
MNFLSELLNDLIIYLTAGRFSTSPRKATFFILGFLELIISMAALIVYSLVLTPSSAERYYVTTIAYSQSYLTGSNKSVVLQAGNTKYFIDHYLWKDKCSGRQVVDALSNSTEATVWLKERNSHAIKGISTSGFNIDPTVGEEADNANRRAVLWLAVLFFALGAACVIAGFTIKPRDPDSGLLE